MNESGKKLALIYEGVSGWQLDVLDESVNRESKEFQSMVAALKQKLSRFANRKGENPPENATAEELALWLMKTKKWFW